MQRPMFNAGKIIDNGTGFGLILVFKNDNKETAITIDSYSKLS